MYWPNKGFGGSSNISPSSAFTCIKLNSSTFRIRHDDKFQEYPFIYVKIYDSVLVIIDTGSGDFSRDPNAQIRLLREYIETVPIADRDREPLNPGGKKGYVVICTHCHYDHIGSVDQFSDHPKSEVWASGYDPSFNSGKNLPETSECEAVGMPTPKYKITHFAKDGDCVAYQGEDLGLVVYLTPGHTPDELAVLDLGENVLYVGDTMYRFSPIIWPVQGNLFHWSETLGRLRSIALEQEATSRKPVKIASGHDTDDEDAAKLLNDVDQFLLWVAEGELRPLREFINGAWYSSFKDSKRSDICFLGPERLFSAFEKDDDAIDKVRKRLEISRSRKIKVKSR